MGQEYSRPKPGESIRVIGAGLPRTGTASLASALQTLLDGPVYHGGTQMTLGPEVEIKTWIKTLSQTPPRNNSERLDNLQCIRRRTEGFVATVDCPGMLYIKELMELYPDARVICTLRDLESWEKSMDAVATTATQYFLRFVLLLLPSMRLFPDYIDRLREVWWLAYGETEPLTRKTYDLHIAWLKENVPADKLTFLHVRDGWAPLCKALDIPVPQSEPFPRINDSRAIDAFAKQQVATGLAVWIAVLAVLAVIVWAVPGWM